MTTLEAPVVPHYTFDDYLTTQNVAEVVWRIRNILGKPGVRFTIAKSNAGIAIPELFAHQKVDTQYGDYLSWADSGFVVSCLNDVAFGASTFYHSAQKQAATAKKTNEAFTFVSIIGGNGLPNLLNQTITIYGINQDGASFYTVVKVEDISSEEAADTEARYIRNAARTFSDFLSPVALDAICQAADDVQNSHESRLGMF